MKAYAHHDETGRIHSLTIVNAPEGCGAMLAPNPGVFVTAFEEVDVAPYAEDVEKLRRFINSRKVPAPTHRRLEKNT